MSSTQFKRDLARGKPAENYVAEMFRSWGFKVNEVRDQFFQPYDLEVIDGANMLICACRFTRPPPMAKTIKEQLKK